MKRESHLVITSVSRFADLIAPFEDTFDDDSSGKKLFQYGVILNQIPVVISEDEDFLEMARARSKVFIEVEKDFPVSVVPINADEWYEHLEIEIDRERLSRDLFILAPLAQEAFQNKHLYLPVEPTSNDWDIIRLAFYLSGRMIVSKPIYYPAFVGIQKLASSKKEDYRNPWTLLGVA